MARDKRHTEFGGGPGSPNRREDGLQKKLTPGERARMVRQELKRDMPSASTPRVVEKANGVGVISTEPLPYDVEMQKDLDARTNGYAREGYDRGDTVS